MKRTKFIALCMAAITALTPVTAFASSETETDSDTAVLQDYTLDSPYKNVDWDTYKAYKTNLHTHSSVSDGNETFRNMIQAAYDQDFDILAFSEHGITGKAWDQQPFIRPLYLYQIAAGYDRKPLTSEEFEAIQNGSAPLSSTGEARGRGMFCVTGANELNAVTLTMSHVNGYFLPETVGNLDWGFENGYDYALSTVEKHGGLSHINHPGDWLSYGKDESAVSKPENIEFFADYLLRYKSCLGIEAVNGFTSVTRYDRILWDNLLMYCLPYGRNVYGFAGADAHDKGRLNSCWEYFMLESVSMDSVRECMENGAFFGATHTVISNSKIGPEQDVYAPDGIMQPVAEVHSFIADGHKITLNVSNAKYVNWIANGKVIERTDFDSDNGTAVLNLDNYDTDGMLYVRAEIYNENGMVFSQPVVLDRGTEPETYTPATGFKATMHKIGFALKSTRIFALFQRLFREIKKAVNK